MIGVAQKVAAFAVSGAAASALLSRHVAHAEDSSAQAQLLSRKPIYDDAVAAAQAVAAAPPPPPPKAPSPIVEAARSRVFSTETPVPTLAEVTDRLTEEIRAVRLGIYGYAAQAEDKTNETVSRIFRLESRISDRIAALAPSSGSQERVSSGLLTVVVASMATSIFTRNRNVLVRGTLPVIVGLATANAVLPETMHNINGLILDAEGRVSPELRRQHEAAVDRLSQFVTTGIHHSKMSVDMIESKIAEARLTLSDWVKGRGR